MRSFPKELLKPIKKTKRKKKNPMKSAQKVELQQFQTSEFPGTYSDHSKMYKVYIEPFHKASDLGISLIVQDSQQKGPVNISQLTSGQGQINDRTLLHNVSKDST